MRTFAHDHRDCLLLATPKELDVDGFADPQRLQHHQEIPHGMHGSAFDGDDDIASHHPGLA